MISNILIFFIFLSCIFKSRNTKQPFMIFVLFCIVMTIIDIALPKYLESYYYLSCALIDLIIIVELSKSQKINNTVILLQKSCLLFIVINLLGWVIYEMYYGPDIYNALCASLFAVILIACENTRNKNVLGDNTVRSDINLFFSGAYSSAIKIQRH